MTALRLSDDGQRLSIQGDMTVYEAPALLAELAAYGGVAEVDLHAVDRVDSAALSVLLAMSRAAGGARIAVHHAPPALRSLGDLYGLHTLIWAV